MDFQAIISILDTNTTTEAKNKTLGIFLNNNYFGPIKPEQLVILVEKIPVISEDYFNKILDKLPKASLPMDIIYKLIGNANLATIWSRLNCLSLAKLLPVFNGEQYINLLKICKEYSVDIHNILVTNNLKLEYLDIISIITFAGKYLNSFIISQYINNLEYFSGDHLIEILIAYFKFNPDHPRLYNLFQSIVDNIDAIDFQNIIDINHITGISCQELLNCFDKKFISYSGTDILELFLNMGQPERFNLIKLIGHKIQGLDPRQIKTICRQFKTDDERRVAAQCLRLPFDLVLSNSLTGSNIIQSKMEGYAYFTDGAHTAKMDISEIPPDSSEFKNPDINIIKGTDGITFYLHGAKPGIGFIGKYARVTISDYGDELFLEYDKNSSERRCFFRGVATITEYETDLIK